MTALAIDLGGTNMRAGLLSDGADMPAPVAHWDAPRGLDAFRMRIAGLLEEHGATRLGVAIPGLADGTVCAWVPNLPFLDGVDLAALFPSAKVALGNDAQFALLAEAAGGAVKGRRNALLLSIGTGIGSAVLADGRIVRGEGGAAASFGWACADPLDGGSDAHGWLERQAAGTALDAAARLIGLDDGKALIGAARAGDERALAALAKPAAALGATLAGAVSLLGCSGIVVAGGVADSIDVLAPLVLPVLRRHLPPHLRGVSLSAGEYDSRAALVGAGLAASGHRLWEEDGQ